MSLHLPVVNRRDTPNSALIAVVFAFIYKAFGGDSITFSVDMAGKQPDLRAYLYYSVVTFTTLGFGDIIPKTNWARFAVGAEVVLGYVMLGCFMLSSVVTYCNIYAPDTASPLLRKQPKEEGSLLQAITILFTFMIIWLGMERLIRNTIAKLEHKGRYKRTSGVRIVSDIILVIISFLLFFFMVQISILFENPGLAMRLVVAFFACIIGYISYISVGYVAALFTDIRRK